MSLPQRINDALLGLLNLERRIDPFFRPAFDRAFRGSLVALAQAGINARRENLHLGIGEERLLPDEEQITASIIETQSAFTRRQYSHALPALRVGNTKTHGAVRGRFEVLPDLPTHLRRGLFAEQRTYPAWVRFAGPGPYAPPDIKDGGILSIGIKLMDVGGPKLLEDEQWTQDFTGITAPTFTTPNIVENLKLQRRILAGAPILYFVNLRDSHLLDGIMQGLFARALGNPLDEQYWSCVAYSLGEGQAMHYSVRPREARRTKIPRRPTPNYLRRAMAETLREREVAFDFLVQIQTDSHAMPIEDASVVWPERRSPFVPVARLVLPVQEFDSPAQMSFAENLSYNPWHSIEGHRPLGNQNRARRRMERQRQDQKRQHRGQ